MVQCHSHIPQNIESSIKTMIKKGKNKTTCRPSNLGEFFFHFLKFYHLTKHIRLTNLILIEIENPFMKTRNYLRLLPSSPPRRKVTRVSQRNVKQDTSSPTLHWSRILYKSLPLETFFPFTDVMMSPKISLP